MQVQEAMNSVTQSCPAQTNLEDIARLMWDNDIGAVPIVSDDYRPIGIVTDRDISMSAMHRHRPLWEIQAAEVIEGQSLCCCQPEESLEGCLRKMEEHQVRRSLVTDQEGKLCGILSLGDIIAFTRQREGRGEALSRSDALQLLQHVSAHHPPRGMDQQRTQVM